MTEKKYEIIYADPPWQYTNKGVQGAAEKHYRTMSLADIMALPVDDLAADNCALFIWVTYPMLQEGLSVIRAWGFEYKTIAFQWIKTYPKCGKFVFGLGHWTRSNTECCLLAIKGAPKRVDKGISQLIVAPILKHSEKPAITRDKIKCLLGGDFRLLNFSRGLKRQAGMFGAMRLKVILNGVRIYEKFE